MSEVQTRGRESVVIADRFRGPPRSGNGGYVCGVMARRLGGPAEVTIRRPVPLDKPLEILEREDGMLVMMDGDELLMEAAPAALAIEVPEPPGFEEAKAAEAGSLALEKGLSRAFPDVRGLHPTCFCCGAEVAAGEGLRLFPGPVEGRDLVACNWVPDPSLDDGTGHVASEYLWAALDCPGSFAYYATGTPNGPLGRLTGKILAPVRIGGKCVVIGWRIEREGRKLYPGTAVFTERGVLAAVAKGVWFARE